ncbi:SCO6880 family protein [Saccharopolyspora pogona]|uniref:SCO6880 family protein n=1 Tax=Saccharopolyspora pogona TaxID=333966 RepID=UPI001685FEA1|nr:SCO6880 family protein [Saccharopolyspora pogona]
MTNMQQYQGQAATVAAEPRYGQWRRPRTAGLLGLGTMFTVIALVWVLFALSAMMFWPLLGWILIGIGVVGLAPLAIKVGGRSVYSLAVARLAYRRGHRRGQHLLLNGPLGLVPGGKHRLPGILAASEMHEAQDSYGRPFGLIRQQGHYTAVLRCDASGDQLVDRDTVDTWVAGWGSWLAKLGQIPGLAGVAVTIETAPDSGERLRTEVAKLTDNSSGPALAKQVLREAAEDYPLAAAQVISRVALTFRSKVSDAAKPRSLEEMAVEIGSRLPELGKELALTGAGAARPMTAQQLAELVFAAYNPAEADDADAARHAALGTGITWENSGPSGTAHELRDRYIHGSGHSVVFAMEEAPRGAVLSSVLREFLAPHMDFDRKRVTLIYRPHDPGRSATIVERDLRHAKTNASKRKVVSARDDADVRAAQQSTDEEASGAGIVSFSLLATATVIELEDLPQATRTLHNLSATARLRLRTVYGGQSAAFAAGLGVGVLPHAFATISTLFEE